MPKKTAHLNQADLTELTAIPPGLLDMTFDQLRTLLAVHTSRSALRAARTLGREQSSVQKQMDTLNRAYQTLCGEVLTVKQGRGKEVLFTPTGEAVVRLARVTFSEWLAEIHASRRRLGSTLTVGTTEFTLSLVSGAWERLAGRFPQVEFKVVHVRTRELWSRLESMAVDLVCGSVVVVRDEEIPTTYEVLELARGRPVLLTNLPQSRLPGTTVRTSRLADLPLVIPPTGLVADFLGTWYGPNIRDRLDVVADIDDIYYGLSLLRTGLALGCMVVTRHLGEYAADGERLRIVDLVNDLEPDPEIMTGAFVRKADRVRFQPEHPLNQLWDAIGNEIADRRAAATESAGRPDG